MRTSLTPRLRELAVVFGTLAVIGFGGPAAHVALARREVVERRRWLSDAQFLDYVGLTSLVPGPNSTELAMLVGRLRGGVPGLLVAGAAFILPAAAIVLVLAWAYVTWGTSPAGERLLLGVQPAIVAVVGAALLALACRALRARLLAAIGVAAAAAWLLGVHELLVLASGALLVAAVRLRPRPPTAAVIAMVPLPWGVESGARFASVDLGTLFGTFLRIGALLYGSGYVLLAFLRGDLVERLGWLTDAQLLDAVAIGQVTPGPLFTTATFVGYLVAGVPGAVVATVAIFLPAFVVVAVLGPVADRVRDRPLTAALLDGVNAAAIGLIAAVTIQLAGAAIRGPLTAAILVGTAALLAWGRVPSAVLVFGAGLIGLLAGALGVRG